MHDGDKDGQIVFSDGRLVLRVLRSGQDLQPEPQMPRLYGERATEFVDQNLGEALRKGLRPGQNELDIDDGHA